MGKEIKGKSPILKKSSVVKKTTNSLFLINMDPEKLGNQIKQNSIKKVEKSNGW